MSVELNHTIVHARDNRDSAEFFAKLLGLDITAEWGPFIAVGLSNGVTLDFATIPADSITPPHDFARYPVKQETCRGAVELASTLLPTVPGVTRAVVLVTDTVSCTCGGLCSPVSSRFRRLPWCSAVMTDTACGAGHSWARCSFNTEERLERLYAVTSGWPWLVDRAHRLHAGLGDADRVLSKLAGMLTYLSEARAFVEATGVQSDAALAAGYRALDKQFQGSTADTEDVVTAAIAYETSGDEEEARWVFACLDAMQVFDREEDGRLRLEPLLQKCLSTGG